MNNSLFDKTSENVRKLKDIKLAIRQNYLVSEPNYHARNVFPENLWAIEIKKNEDTQILMKNRSK